MNNTSIEWTDVTLNPIKGCTDATYKDGTPRRGCQNCYARRIAARLASNPTQKKYAGLALFDADKVPKWTGQLVFDGAELDKLRKLKVPKQIFIESMGDIAHDDVPWHWYEQIFEALIDVQPVGHAFYLLSKRPARQAELLVAMKNRFGLQKYWQVMKQAVVMTTLEDERAVREFLPDLMATRAYRLGISAEPLASSISIIPLFREMHPYPQAIYQLIACSVMDRPAVRAWYPKRLRMAEARDIHESKILRAEAEARAPWLLPTEEDAGLEEMCNALLGAMSEPDRNLAHHLETDLDKGGLRIRRLSWVITGGESGFGAMPSHPVWFRRLRDDCELLGVPFHFKHWGAWGPVSPAWEDGNNLAPLGKVLAHTEAGHRVVAIEPGGMISYDEHAEHHLEPGPEAYYMVQRPKRDNGRELDGRPWDGSPGIIG
jgi:protein gp37